MTIFFKNSDVDSFPLTDYVKSFIKAEETNYGLFQLPPIQRNAVWNVAQIEMLWDSILRGFPIGSFIVAPRKQSTISRDVIEGLQTPSATDGYFLLDGQQRTRGILLGFIPAPNRRLWIDLNPQLKFENSDFNDRKFLLRVLTKHQPWGMQDGDPKAKLPETQKYNARKELGTEKLRYDYLVPINTAQSPGEHEQSSWPVKAALPLPMDTLMQLFGGLTGKYVIPSWEDVIKIIPYRYHNASLIPTAPPDHFFEIAKAIRPLIDKSGQRAKSIVLIFQNQYEAYHDENVQDDMEVLFGRINSGGTKLEGEEMAYSILKSNWDGAYELVSKIVGDQSIGYLLRSTGIVMAAARLSRYIQEKADVPNPGARNFRRWIGEQAEAGNPNFLKVMQKLLNPANEGRSMFHSIIEAFCELVVYREGFTNDIGLPKKLLLAINPSLFHPVFVWIYNQSINKETLERNRLNVLRYLVHCFLTIDNHEKVSKFAIEEIKKNDSTDFPDKAIYERLVDEEESVIIPSPAEFEKPFTIPADGYLRTKEELFNLESDKHNSYRNWFWDAKEMLLWFQRQYLPKWFAGYDPTSSDAYDTPYDWDHILPKSHLIGQGISNTIMELTGELKNKFEWSRGHYAHSIGNFRMWPFWCNRSDNANCHTLKLRMVSSNFIDDDTANELGLNSTYEFLIASAINPADEQLWLSAGGSARYWPQERRIAWQQAVEKRACYLYETLYKSFNFEFYRD